MCGVGANRRSVQPNSPLDKWMERPLWQMGKWASVQRGRVGKCAKRTVTLEREGLTLVIKDVPAQVRLNCGEPLWTKR
jgi:hypothetical protein